MYLNLHNDASFKVNLTVTVDVPAVKTATRTFTVEPGTTPVEIKITGVGGNHQIDPSEVKVRVSGVRCE